MSVGVSVVMPCKNAATVLPDALTALSRERLDEPWEVVIVDDVSADETRAVAERFAEVLSLRVLEPPISRGPWHARNVGAAAACGENLLFLDSDDVIAPGYVAAMRGALEASELVAAYLEGDTLNQGWVRQTRTLGLEDGLHRHLGYLPFAASSCLGIRRSVFEELGGFAPLAALEDADLCWRAQLRGFELRVAPGAVLHYRYRNTFPGILRQAFGYGQGEPTAYRRFRALGMPRRGLRRAGRDWADVARRLCRARTKGDLGHALFLLGLAAGRAVASARQRVVYL